MGQLRAKVDSAVGTACPSTLLPKSTYRICRIKRPPKADLEWFFKGGSTQNRWVLMGDFQTGGGSTQNRWVLRGDFQRGGGLHKTDGSSEVIFKREGEVPKTDRFWWVIFQRGGGVPKTDGSWWVIFQRGGGVPKTDRSWCVFGMFITSKRLNARGVYFEKYGLWGLEPFFLKNLEADINIPCTGFVYVLLNRHQWLDMMVRKNP